MADSVRKTKLYDEHVRLGANMVDFHGWMMPLYYDSIIKEHNYVREGCGMFDVSHMGDIFIEGEDAEKTLLHLVPTDIRLMKDGDCVYSAFLNENGNIIDDTIIYKFNKKKFLCVPNASMISRIYNHIAKNKIGDTKVEDKSDDLSCIAVQGKKSEEILNDIDINFPESFKFFESENRIVSGTGYTGEKGCEIIIENDKVVKLWNELLKSIKKIGYGPCGLGSRDTLRMEKGMLLSGQDFNENRNPYEASISFIVNNETEFIGKNALMNRNNECIFRGFIVNEKNAFPRTGNKIFNNEGEEIGEITSGTLSPSLKKGIGLGYISKKYQKVGTDVKIETRRGKVSSIVSKPRLLP